MESEKIPVVLNFRFPNHNDIINYSGFFKELSCNEAIHSQPQKNVGIITPFFNKNIIGVVEIDEHQIGLPFPELSPYHLPLKSHQDLKSDFINFIEQFFQQSKTQTDFKKVVASTTKFVSSPQKLNLDSVQSHFDFLCQKFQNCLVALFSFGNEVWLSASPEVLLDYKNNSYFIHSLAGTQQSTTGFENKEIQEQNIVSRYINDVLIQQNINPQIHPSEFFQYGDLFHLRNTFQFNGSPDFNPYELIALLHPTPAVGGVKKEVAIEFIQNTEKHDRKFYTGYFGYFDSEGNPHIYVNLRTMQFFQNGILYYAGAGITPESIPEKEWQEVNLKMEQVRYQ